VSEELDHLKRQVADLFGFILQGRIGETMTTEMVDREIFDDEIWFMLQTVERNDFKSIADRVSFLEMYVARADTCRACAHIKSDHNAGDGQGCLAVDEYDGATHSYARCHCRDFISRVSVEKKQLARSFMQASVKAQSLQCASCTHTKREHMGKLGGQPVYFCHMCGCQRFNTGAIEAGNKVIVNQNQKPATVEVVLYRVRYDDPGMDDELLPSEKFMTTEEV
jgi:hypothetical protein